MSRLLVVDDEPSICWALKRLGQSLGHEVVTAASAEQALELAASQAPDAVVLDVKTGIAFEGEACGAPFCSEDRKEGMSAFLEKRPAKFENK